MSDDKPLMHRDTAAVSLKSEIKLNGEEISL